MPSQIPIRNVYYLLVYAWDRLAESELVDIEGVETTELVDLYAAVLLGGLRHLTRRGLDQTYLVHEEEIAGVRGRVNMAATARRMLVQHGRAHCAFDELSVDSLPNRILVSTIRRLSRSPDLNKELKHQLRATERGLAAISEVHLTRQLFSRVQLHRNNSFYKFLLSVCELVYESSMGTEEAGSYRFRDFVRDPDRMAQLFERFVFNFLRIEVGSAEIKRERIYWAAQSADDPDLLLLPTMQTDISLRRPGKTLIIDAKFYQKTLQTNFGVDSVHSGHLYQLFAYLKNLEVKGGQDALAEGMLLYPTVDTKLRLKYEIFGHTIRFCTVDLAQDWRQIRDEILELVA